LRKPFQIDLSLSTLSESNVTVPAALTSEIRELLVELAAGNHMKNWPLFPIRTRSKTVFN
jgi:hypothetical protein